MKLSRFLILTSTIIMLAFSSNIMAQKYVGVKKCAMCHKSKKIGAQYKIWKKTKHAKAYETLKTEKADKISMKKDGKKAVDNPNCLKCHVTAYGVDKSLLGKKFKMENGVQCETCHGPGSKYKKKKIMKNHAKAVANGLVEYKTKADIEKKCKTCHNEKSPSYKGFDFEKRWKEIAHYIPGKKK